MTDTTPRTWLDAGGSARPHPVALQASAQALADGWADPRRLGAEGRRARAMLDASRAAVAEVVGARTEEVHLAPSHTAALHAAVAAVAAGRRRVGTRVVLAPVERAAVLHAVDHVGLERVLAPVGTTGATDPARFAALVRTDGVALAALQHANGEVGTLQPVDEVHAAARAVGVPLLVDAGASAGHVPLGDAWDVLALDPADWGGLPGAGVLVVRRGVRWRPTWPEDEDGWFPGGVPVPAAFAAAASLQAVEADRAAQDARRRELVEHLRREVVARVPDVEVVGDPDDRLPHVLTFSCLYVDGEALLTELDRAGFAVGSGSACTSGALEPSHVLAAMGVLTHGNVRVVLGREVDRDDVDRFLAVLPGAVARVRSTLGADGL
ncbi:cysteine desulfurase family protein [Luteimicrobium subarcticum]|uniref:Cysteine desulfurase n=1 Tax=Luteimicrobium subarcticum TaxID=620910 RepID=A0A2M8WRC9_9MICO|nr:aminotransferase class V-fold PLP-dependent enzyme [Luteimicrobium subarcticum]PJI93479.1 cysteine desulfurase [Luteimicrobium subarcticum]